MTGCRATDSYVPRLRHAMFRLNWPETELMFGQYFGMFSEYAPEGTGDSQLTNHGFINQRVPQIRLTQKFAGAWTVAGAICKPYDPAATDVNFITPNVNTGQVFYTRHGQPTRLAGPVFRDPAAPGEDRLRG